MKNNRRNPEITSEDFDSPFLWKVFWNLIRQETPLVFLLKVVPVAAFFMTLILFTFCSALFRVTLKK